MVNAPAPCTTSVANAASAPIDGFGTRRSSPRLEESARQPVAEALGADWPGLPVAEAAALKYARLIGGGGVPTYMTHAESDPLPALATYEYRKFMRKGLESWALFGFAVVLDFDGARIRIRYVDENGLYPQAGNRRIVGAAHKTARISISLFILFLKQAG
jgi:hypothetical protein